MSRLAALTLVALAGSLMAACGDDQSSPPETMAVADAAASSTTELVARTPPGGSLEVLVLGDSVMFDASAAIEAGMEATGAATVTTSAVFGFGFSEGAAVPFADAADDLLDGEPAEQVVIMVGSWDHLAVQRDPAGYAASVRSAFEALAEGDRSVLVLGEPPSDPGKGEEEARDALNDVLATVASAVPGVRYLSTDAVIGGDDGEFVVSAGGERLRKPDGRHLCPAGAQRFGDAVLAELQRDWVLPPAGRSWSTGDWRLDPRYDDPPGACTP